MEKVQLEIVALSSSVSQTHSYAVVLGEMDGVRKMPIVIGAFEAQAIVVALEKLTPGRPLTHDLFQHTLEAFNIEIVEIVIYKLEEGIFFSKLVCMKEQRIIEIDSRTSDALALAVRVDCPIFTYEHILTSASIAPDLTVQPTDSQESLSSGDEKLSNDQENTNDNLESMTIEELKEQLQEVLDKEDYMQAVVIRDELNKRKSA